jgi:ABC-type nitrate/sulfonate/bicarbonate transport system, ATPase component
MQTINRKVDKSGAEGADGFIAVRSLSYSYKNLAIFDGLSFSAHSRTVILRGPSGSGKTTLLKLLSGNLDPNSAVLMPSSQSSCLVLQEDSLFPWLSGIENITVLTKIKQAQFQKHPMFHLIAPFVAKKACEMSYGQRRLVELFRAIIWRPRYLYLDEPFNFLDEEKIALLIPFLNDESMANTDVILSNHHREDLSNLGSATILHFDGNFPITTLTQTEQR